MQTRLIKFRLTRLSVGHVNRSGGKVQNNLFLAHCKAKNANSVEAAGPTNYQTHKTTPNTPQANSKTTTQTPKAVILFHQALGRSSCLALSNFRHVGSSVFHRTMTIFCLLNVLCFSWPSEVNGAPIFPSGCAARHRYIPIMTLSALFFLLSCPVHLHVNTQIGKMAQSKTLAQVQV